MPLRVAAIDFLNPAPLMWGLSTNSRFAVHYTSPANCARQLLAGEADLGLIPVAALTPALRIVPGCTIASLRRVRSIQLISRVPLPEIRTVAADTASRSSVAYAEVLLRRFLGASPRFLPAPADPVAMLAQADAALVIGDPALVALEQQAAIDRTSGPLQWHDVAELWHTHTGLPWVAAVWAVRPEAVPTAADRAQLIADLTAARQAGEAHIEALVREWTPRIAIPPATIRTYLTENIHYTLDQPCLETITLFRRLAAELSILPPLPELRMLSG